MEQIDFLVAVSENVALDDQGGEEKGSLDRKRPASGNGKAGAPSKEEAAAEILKGTTENGKPVAGHNGRKRQRRGPKAEPPTPADVASAFKMLDPEGQGFITKDGLISVFRTLQGRDLTEHEIDLMMWSAQSRADSRGGKIEPEAFQTLVDTFL
jgi:hypothetical protein